jgi:PD-(D/E)XK endonuclease
MIGTVTTLGKGSRVVGAIIGDLLRHGFNALLPLGHDRGYDLAVEIGGQFYRVQSAKIHTACWRIRIEPGDLAP